MKTLKINATDRNTINHDNYQFYFNKLLTLKGFKIQNDVLTKEMIKADGFRLISTILGIIGTCFMIYNYMSPDTTVKTAGHVATSASNILNRAITLVNFGYRDRNNEEFIEKIIYFDRDKTELDLEVILDRRYKINTLNTTGKKYLTECVASKDNTKDVIEILAKYVGCN